MKSATRNWTDSCCKSEWESLAVSVDVSRRSGMCHQMLFHQLECVYSKDGKKMCDKSDFGTKAKDFMLMKTPKTNHHGNEPWGEMLW